MTKTITILFALCMALASYAQYPQLTPEAQLRADSLKAAWKAESDSAWAVALPIVMKEAAEGRPYIPWAARPYDLPQAPIPAFPGAEGGGMYSFGGRGGRVIVVTNLNDSGKGSLRWACQQGGARTVVFNVSGVIHLKSPISVRAPYITIAGQTAPGDGVCITGEAFLIDTHDVIVRHMRFRRGQAGVTVREDSFGGNPVGNIMIDHCSCQWGADENISFYRHMYPTTGQKRKKLPTVNVTIQNCISAKALDTWNHAFGSTLGGENCSFIRNLWASNTGRNPSIGWNGVFNFINNVVFNWHHRSADGGDFRAMFNMINNYYKPGPATPGGAVSHRILKVDGTRQADGQTLYGRVYAAGNIVEGNPAVTRDNWAGGIQLSGARLTPAIEGVIRSARPFDMPETAISSAEEAYRHVLQHAGATLPKRDRIDQMVIEEVRTGQAVYDRKGARRAEKSMKECMWGLADVSKNEEGTFRHRRMDSRSYLKGIITHPDQMGGLPEYHGTPRTDTDGDGMPDSWERANGLDPDNPADATAYASPGGYTNIERYINSIGE